MNLKTYEHIGIAADLFPGLWAHLRGSGSSKVTQILSLHPDRTIKIRTIPTRDGNA